MKWNTLLDRLLDCLFVLAGVLLVVATFSVCWGIFSRYVLSRPLGWLVEVNEYILLCIAFLVSAWVLRQEGHVKMDVVLSLLNPRMQLVVNIVTSIVSAVVCLIFTWFSLKVTWELFQKKTLTPTVLEVPKFFLTSVIFFGSFLLVIQFIRRTRGFLQSWRGQKDQ
ncbi:TRAP transporter small permease [bacterium]|nr:TRAP transporter small permease [bacterium]